MNNNISLSKIAAPYANALFLFCVDEDIVHQIAADFYNLKQIVNETDNLISCLNNPVIDLDKKHQILIGGSQGPISGIGGHKMDPQIYRGGPRPPQKRN